LFRAQVPLYAVGFLRKGFAVRLVYRSISSRWLLSLTAVLLAGVVLYVPASAQVVQTQWTQPTAEELSMTAQPQVPGAAAVYLYREETMDDLLHMSSIYVRLKVLTEAGKESADVVLGTTSGQQAYYYGDQDFSESITDVSGRTIHPDGTVIPFTGKPYKRTIEKAGDYKLQETVFTLPAVEVGSIIEYRYKRRIPDNWGKPPQWYVQQDLFVRKGYYFWKATEDPFIDPLRNTLTTGIAWSQVLPAGATVVHVEKPAIGTADPYQTFELKVNDVAPMPEEEYMPPVRSLSYRVTFYHAVDRTGAEFWKNSGKAWAKNQDKFIGSTGSLAQQVNTLIAAGDSDSVKLKKIYAAVMSMDNTTFSRQHERSEDKAQGLKEVKTAQDVWDQRRGGDDQLTDLFVALARSAGMKAYVMSVTNRDRNIFSPNWLTLRQLDDNVAIVVVDGKEQFYDPGQRYCPFGQMAWKHSGVQGLRQTESGTAIDITPDAIYIQSQVQRVGDLAMKADGTAAGNIKITWMGQSALQWRQQGLRGDEDAVKRGMRKSLESMIPTMDVTVTSVDNLTDYEKPLVAHFDVHGQLATVTAKRLILPGQLFESTSKPLFPHETRTVGIDFNYGRRVIDAVRVKFPPGVTVESVPKEDSFTLKSLAAYHSKTEQQPTYVLMRRTYDLGVPFFMPPEYNDVREFYNKLATDDQLPVLLSADTTTAAQPAAATATDHAKSN